MSGLSPIGLDYRETISLQTRLYSEQLETLISCCLALKSESLSRTYEGLRHLRPSARNQAISDPILSLAIHNLVQGLRESSHDSISNGTLQLKWLVDSYSQNDYWAPFSQSRSIYLPFDAVVLQSTKRLEGLFVHREASRVFVSIDQSTFELRFSKESSVLRFELGDRHWLIAWKLSDEIFRVDSVSGLYAPVVPEEYDREQLSPNELSKWSNSISEIVELLQCSSLGDTLTDLKTLVRVIVPLKPKQGSHLSSSSPEFPTVICMSWADDILQFLEAIVHEAGHHKLCLVERQGQLTLSSDAIFRSPWRDDPRPADGLIHGSYAFLGVTTLWDSLLKSTTLPTKYVASIAHRKRIALRQIADALSELSNAKCLTELGADVIESIARVHNSQVKDCDFDLGNFAGKRPLDTVKKNRDELSLLGELSVDYDWLLPLYSSTNDTLDRTIKRIDMARAPKSIARKRLPVYYLWWALPLVEAFGLSDKLDEARFWVPVHLRFGLIWRFLDEVVDGHSTNNREQQMYYDAAIGLLVENVELLSSRSIHFSSGLRRLLFHFYAYRSIEVNGSIKTEDIWRRASAFLVVPQILRGAQPELFRAYKEYCIFLGLLDDLEDGWEDLGAGRRTWITEMLSTKAPDQCKLEFRSKCDSYRSRLQKVIPSHMSLWKTLLELSSRHADDLVSQII